MIELFWPLGVQVEQIWQTAGSEVRDGREEPLHEVHLQHR